MGERAKEFARDLFDRQAVRFETTFAGRHSARMKRAALACVKPRRGTCWMSAAVPAFCLRCWPIPRN